MKITKRKPFHPGEILLEEFMQPYNMTQEELANRIYVTRRRINEIINGRRGITPDTALRLGRLFKMSAEYWLNLQTKFDLWEQLHSPKIRHELKTIKTLSQREREAIL